jgi:hypothetical protein
MPAYANEYTFQVTGDQIENLLWTDRWHQLYGVAYVNSEHVKFYIQIV